MSEFKCDLDIVVMSFNRKKNLEVCLASVIDNTSVPFHLIIVDPGSTDGSREWLIQNYSDKATLIFEKFRWSYAQSCNNGMRYGRSAYVSLLNDDCKVLPGWDTACINTMEKDKTIGHGAHVVLRRDENHVMSAGANIAEGGGTIIPMMDLEYQNPSDRDKIENPEKYGLSRNHAYAGFGIYRRDILERLGYLPEFPVVIYWDDTDYGMKVNALGYDVRLIPESVIVHYMEHSGREQHVPSTVYGRQCFMERWSDSLKKNSGYSPDEKNKVRPYLNNSEGEYNGESYKPLKFPVSGIALNPVNCEPTWK